MDSSPRNCSQHPPVTAILGTSSPISGIRQQHLPPKEKTEGGGGRREKARRESARDSERKREPEGRGWCPLGASPVTENTTCTSPPRSHAPRRSDRRLQQQPCRTPSPQPARRQLPVSHPHDPLWASLPFPSTSHSDRSRGRRPLTHAVLGPRCNHAATPSSRRRGADRTFRTVGVAEEGEGRQSPGLALLRGPRRAGVALTAEVVD